MSNLIPEKKYEAREIVDYQYFQQMIPEGWTSTHSTNKFDRWDVTITNGQSVVYVELKGRDYPIEKLNGEAWIECSKIDYLYKLGRACLVEFFWKSNVTYVWSVKDKFNWRKELKDLPKNNIDKTEKEPTWVYILPLDEKNARYTVDLTNYHTDFMSTWEELSKNND